MECITSAPATITAATTTGMITLSTIFLTGEGFFGGTGTVFSGSCSGSSSASFSKSSISPLIEAAGWADGITAVSKFSDSSGTVDMRPSSAVSCWSPILTGVEGLSSISGKLSGGMSQSSLIASSRNRSDGVSPTGGRPLSSAAISSPFHGQKINHRSSVSY